MNGKILSITGGRGIVLGDDGSRYSFAMSDFKGEEPPVVQANVDFVVDGASAVEIYPLADSSAPKSRLGEAVMGRVAAAEKALSDQSSNDMLANAKTVIAERPQVVLCVLMLFVSFAFSWLTLGSMMGGARVDPSLISLPGIISDIRAPLEDTLAKMEEYMARNQDSPFATPETLAMASSNLSTASTALWIMRFAPILYLIPLGAAFALFLEYRGRRSRVLEMSLGIVACVALLAVLFGRDMLAETITKDFGTGGATVRSLIKIGFGGWLTTLCGIGLVLTSIGALRRTPGF